LQGKENVGKDTGWADGKVYSQKNDAIQNNSGSIFNILEIGSIYVLLFPLIIA
jgi:hypothetical protein